MADTQIDWQTERKERNEQVRWQASKWAMVQLVLQQLDRLIARGKMPLTSGKASAHELNRNRETDKFQK